MRYLIITLLALTFLFVSRGAAVANTANPQQDQPELILLDEIQPGMEGEWKTVIRGTEIVSFPLRVLGVIENFIGPGQAAILCEALDDSNRLTGPVAGMSGSPVYFGGRLAGAYAYGFTNSKDQAIIGVTPIETMLGMVDLLPLHLPTEGNPGQGGASPGFSGLGTSAESPELRDNPASEPLSRRLFPLAVAGLHPSVEHTFSEKFRQRGFELQSVPSGTSGNSFEGTALQPGAAIAGLLMTGDFAAAATGTVTWTDGERFLAFGHPFLQQGKVAIPAAHAEILTVVQSNQRSFKLSAPGPVVGAITQDRLPAVAGRIGLEAPLCDLEIRVNNSFSQPVTRKGGVVPDPNLGPLLTAMAVMQGTTQDAVLAPGGMLKARIRWEFDDTSEDLEWSKTFSGTAPSRDLALEMMEVLSVWAAPAYSLPFPDKISVEVDFGEKAEVFWLVRASLSHEKAAPGETIQLKLVMRGWDGQNRQMNLPLVVPDLPRGRAVFSVSDARGWESLQSIAPEQAYGPEDLKLRLKNRPDTGSMYLAFGTVGQGFLVDGQALPGLPRSFSQKLSDSQTRDLSQPFPLQWNSLAPVPMEGQFFGNTTITLDIL